jgi:hypothetical protein
MGHTATTVAVQPVCADPERGGREARSDDARGLAGPTVNPCWTQNIQAQVQTGLSPRGSIPCGRGETEYRAALRNERSHS